MCGGHWKQRTQTTKDSGHILLLNISYTLGAFN